MATSTREKERGSNHDMTLDGVWFAHLWREGGVVAQVWSSWYVPELMVLEKAQIAGERICECRRACKCRAG